MRIETFNEFVEQLNLNEELSLTIDKIIHRKVFLDILETNVSGSIQNVSFVRNEHGEIIVKVILNKLKEGKLSEITNKLTKTFKSILRKKVPAFNLNLTNEKSSIGIMDNFSNRIKNDFDVHNDLLLTLKYGL